MKRSAGWGTFRFMMHYDEYEASEGAIDDLLEAAELGRLVTLGGDLVPHIGLYPFYLLDGSLPLARPSARRHHCWVSAVYRTSAPAAKPPRHRKASRVDIEVGQAADPPAGNLAHDGL